MASEKGSTIAVEGADDEAVEDLRDRCISRFSCTIQILDLFFFFLFFVFLENDEVLTSKRLLFGGDFSFEVIGSLNF